MNHKVLSFFAAASFSLLLFAVGCSPVAGAHTYNSIFIDTYDPIDPTGANGASITNYMELWSSDGKTLLASYDGLNDFRTANFSFAYIDYSPNNLAVQNYAPLTSGDYWVLVKESGGGSDPIDYGIRVLVSPPASYTSTTYNGWTFGGTASESTSDQPTTGGGGIPSSYKTIVFSNSTNDKLNRHIVGGGGGVNWIKITLP